MYRRLLTFALMLAPVTAPVAQERVFASAGHVAAHRHERDDEDDRVGAAPRNYFADYLLVRDSTVRRWTDRHDAPIRVWVQPARTLAGWDDAFPAMVEDAFEEWNAVGLPLRFRFVDDSATAEVRVVWTERLPQGESGRTVWWSTPTGQIRRAQVTLAMHASDGATQHPRALRAVALHEVGHVLGLGHTHDARDIMAPWVEVATLSDADRATARILYRLPTGRIGAGDARVAEAAAGVAVEPFPAGAVTVAVDDAPLPLAPIATLTPRAVTVPVIASPSPGEIGAVSVVAPRPVLDPVTLAIVTTRLD
ncbi:MAG: matrixin family metalloprotease [Gemmatimonadaceae bacterium]|jgi:hypothetical protein|nr:matrixin family metalloprotease [Gemmatimonadaceae bacterium]